MKCNIFQQVKNVQGNIVDSPLHKELLKHHSRDIANKVIEDVHSVKFQWTNGVFESMLDQIRSKKSLADVRKIVSFDFYPTTAEPLYESPLVQELVKKYTPEITEVSTDVNTTLSKVPVVPIVEKSKKETTESEITDITAVSILPTQGEEQTKTDVKPTTPLIREGVSELFESNPELANEVYEALGFTKSTFDTKGITLSEETSIGWMLIQLNNKKIGRVKFVNNGEKGQLGLSIEINEEYQNKGYGQIVHTLMADLAKKDYKSNLYSDYQNSSQEIQLLNSLVKKGYAEKIGDIGKASKEYPDSFVTQERAFRIKTSDEIGTITPQQKEEAQQLYSQYLESLNKPNTNPILQNNQQEQVKKFAELQERLNNKEFLEGAKNAYESSKGLQEWGTQEQYNDYIARVSLGILKNPSSGEYNYTSKVKDIVYRGGKLRNKTTTRCRSIYYK
jgi:hypothetical protein